MIYKLLIIYQLKVKKKSRTYLKNLKNKFKKMKFKVNTTEIEGKTSKMYEKPRK